MRVVRVQTSSGPSYGVVLGDEVHLLAGSPFEVGHRPEDIATGERVDLQDARLLPPVAPSKILAVGRNYADHAAEMGLPTGAEPAVFLKPPSSLLAPGGTVVLPDPRLSVDVEHEAELAVVLGAPLRDATPGEAAAAVFGLTCANDVSARDLQRRDPHITRAKGFDTFCPLGPWIETDAAPAEGRAVRCRVNGELRQDGSTSDLLFSVPDLLSHLSRWTTLLPGDLVLTGTPAGTGPLRRGDRVEVDVEGVGVLEHEVAERPPPGKMTSR
jgi:2-keto-4-pentenoate hydratase/2-oxohepta-3-ene-1,7-dioic acid hydratase in catechol pathway